MLRHGHAAKLITQVQMCIQDRLLRETDSVWLRSLEREDDVVYSRDFRMDHILVAGADEVSVGVQESWEGRFPNTYNPDAYNHLLRWKYEGPSDSFKALLDMAAVHSSCRLCIHLATRIRDSEEKNSISQKRPFKCTRGVETVYHVYVRERGRFEMESIFLGSYNLTLNAFKNEVLEKFNGLKHVPIWKQERPDSINGGDDLKIYRIYPLGLTQIQALYTFRFQGDSDFRSHIQSNPCSKFEVIFL